MNFGAVDVVVNSRGMMEDRGNGGPRYAALAGERDNCDNQRR
jgi:hypothetical protein